MTAHQFLPRLLARVLITVQPMPVSIPPMLDLAPRDMSRGDISQPWFYHMEDVPYTFYFNGNQALHGAYWHDEFGTQQSHGCVNMSLTAAYWVYDFLSETLDVSDDDAIWPMVWVY